MLDGIMEKGCMCPTAPALSTVHVMRDHDAAGSNDVAVFSRQRLSFALALGGKAATHDACVSLLFVRTACYEEDDFTILSRKDCDRKVSSPRPAEIVVQ